MIYLWPQASSMLEFPSNYGVLTSPGHNSVAVSIKEGRLWACDNGAFTGFNETAYLTHLKKLEPYRQTCLFIVAPDVVGYARKTLRLYKEWHLRLKDDWPVAFVAQDGQECLPLPEFDWLFIGGSTAWKMSERAVDCINQAKLMGKRVHVGRVNSWKRYSHFRMLGADSCDGTHPIYEPDRAKNRITGWMAQGSFDVDVFRSNNSGKSNNN